MLAPFATKSTFGAFAQSGERLVNCWARGNDGIGAATLVGRSGLSLHCNLEGHVRALEGVDERLYAVAGGKLWRVIDAVPEELGLVADDANTHMASGSGQVAITAGGKYYIFKDEVLSIVSPGAVSTPKSVAYIRGYFVVGGSGLGRRDLIQVSALDDGATFDALDFISAEASTDRLHRLIVNHDALYAFGDRSTEAYYIASSGFPLALAEGRTWEMGTAAPMTVAKRDGAIYFLGTDKRVHRSMGGAYPQAISDPLTTEALFPETVNHAFTCRDRGADFYVICRTGKTCLALNLQSGLWSEFGTETTETEWIATCSAAVEEREFLGTSTGKIARMIQGTYTDLGDPVVMEAVSVPEERRGRPFSVADLTLSVGDGAVSYAEPQIMLQTSRDGRNWGRERWRVLGGLGSYRQNARWVGLGTFESRFQAKIRITDPVNRDIHGVFYNGG